MTIRRFIGDLLKIMVLMVLVGYGLYLLDPANVVVFQAMGIAVFMVGGTHLTRRILMHRMDLQDIARRAVVDENLPAAIVFFAVVIFLVAVMFVSLQVLR